MTARLIIESILIIISVVGLLSGTAYLIAYIITKTD